MPDTEFSKRYTKCDQQVYIDAAGVVGANLKISCSAFFNTPNPSSCDNISSIPVHQGGTVMTLINIRPVGRINFRTNDCKHIPDIFRASYSRLFPAPLLLVIHYSYNHANQIKSNTLLSEIFSWSYVNIYLNFCRVMTMIRIHQAQSIILLRIQVIAKLLYLSCNFWISLEPTAECRSKGVRPIPACRTLGEVNLVARHNLPRVSNCCILHEPLWSSSP